MHYLIALSLAALAACSESPVAPAPTDPGWCNQVLADRLVGDYTRHYHRGPEQFMVFLSIEPHEGDCRYSFRVEHRIIGDNPKTMFMAYGDMLVFSARAIGPMATYTAEVLSLYSEQRAYQGDEVLVDDSPRLNETRQAKLWGDALRLWGNDYQRAD